jgi:hypothetical protein
VPGWAEKNQEVFLSWFSEQRSCLEIDTARHPYANRNVTALATFNVLNKVFSESHFYNGQKRCILPHSNCLV